MTEYVRTAEDDRLEGILRRLADRLDAVDEDSAEHKMIVRQMEGIRRDSELGRLLMEELEIGRPNWRCVMETVLRGDAAHRCRAAGAIHGSSLANNSGPRDLITAGRGAHAVVDLLEGGKIRINWERTNVAKEDKSREAALALQHHGNGPRPCRVAWPRDGEGRSAMPNEGLLAIINIQQEASKALGLPEDLDLMTGDPLIDL
jgi:hypothetical protein